MPIIENEYLKVEASLLGGELLHVIDKENNQELLYQANEVWPHHDVILFPFIGPDSSYRIDGRKYSCPTQHGFIRTSRFELVEEKENKLVMEFHDNEKTFESYPFHFVLRAIYSLENRTLKREYEIINQNEEELPFQLGDHAAYQVKFGEAILHLGEGSIFFYPRKNLAFSAQPISFLRDKDYLLNKKDFAEFETILIEKPRNELVLDTGLGYLLAYHFPSPYIAIWSPSKESSFLCIEPWWGMAIYEGRDEEMRNWKDINSISHQAHFEESITFSKKAK